MMDKRIYLDYAATTPTDQRVLDEMLPYFNSSFGNAASSEHAYGWDADEAVKKARKQIAELIKANSTEIIFTSGATESNNLALKGFFQRNVTKGNHVISCVTEHKSILDSVEHLRNTGKNTTLLGVNSNGSINLDKLEQSITSQTVLISLMAVNNETGTLHPLKEIGKIARKHRVIFHTDATQAVGKIPIDVSDMGINLLSLSAHKIYGPKGVGALYVRKRSPKLELEPIIHGGGHEQGMRSGTLNVPGIVGFGLACVLAGQELDDEAIRIQNLRKKLCEGLTGNLKGVTINGHFEKSIPGILNLSFSNIENSNLIRDLEGVAISSGSACTSEIIGPSHVIEALGENHKNPRSAVRFSIGRFTTEAEIDFVIKRVSKAVKELRSLE
jgi:cysteine desulfurase